MFILPNDTGITKWSWNGDLMDIIVQQHRNERLLGVTYESQSNLFCTWKWKPQNCEFAWFKHKKKGAHRCHQVMGIFYERPEMLAWMLIFILSLLGVTFPPPPLCDALIKMVTLLLLVYVPLSFSWFLSLSLSSLSLSLQECWVALCPSHLETALPSLLMSLHFGRRGEKAREPFPLLQLTAVPSRSPLLIPTWDCTRGLE